MVVNGASDFPLRVVRSTSGNIFPSTHMLSGEREALVSSTPRGALSGWSGPLSSVHSTCQSLPVVKKESLRLILWPRCMAYRGERGTGVRGTCVSVYQMSHWRRVGLRRETNFPPLAKNKFIALCLQLLCPHLEDHQPTFLCRSSSGETVSEYPLAVGMRF